MLFQGKGDLSMHKDHGKYKGKRLLKTKTKIPPGIIQDHPDGLVGKGSSPGQGRSNTHQLLGMGLGYWKALVL